MQSRNHAIDWLRAWSVLYIVGYWHLFNYVLNFPQYANIYTTYLTYIVLGIFTLTSGYLLATRSLHLNFYEVKTFYYRRLIRIYPLYFLALIAFLFTGLANSKTVLKGMLLTSMLQPPAPPTLWFITMIMLFYVIAPVLISYTEQLIAYLIWCGIIIISLISIHVFIQPIDLRILMYFPAFAAGIIIARNQLLHYMLNKYRWLLALLLMPAFWLFTTGKDNTLYGIAALIPSIVVGSLAFLVYAEQYLGNRYNAIIAVISYASFCMYLFHRIVYKYLVMLYFPQELLLQIAYLLIFGVGISFIISYMIQKYYDDSIVRLGYK